MNQHQSFKRLTLYFGLFATVAAGMIGLGQGSWNIPLLVAFCSVASMIYTDKLGWVSLPLWLVYVGMIVGAGVAIANFLGDASANQILAVGNLLVYVQLPLMFQKKSKRVFEQWGVFLLLELVVAALVNDNILYGVLMLPVLALGCAALMALAQFASFLRHSESVSESTSPWARLLHWLGKEQLVTKRNSGVTLSTIESAASLQRSSRFVPSKWIRSVLPMTAIILLFATAYFYSLPRLSSRAYEPENWGAPQVGFSEQISLRQIGDMLQNDSPVFRMSMRDNKTQKNYRPVLPPYIRMSVAHHYLDGPTKGMWDRAENGYLVDPKQASIIPSPSELQPELRRTTDSITVSFVEKSSLGSVVPSLPPFSVESSIKDFQVMRKDWRIVDTRETSRPASRKRRYSYITHAFSSGMDTALIQDYQSCLREDAGMNATSSLASYLSRDLLEFPPSLSSVLPLRDKILSVSSTKEDDKLSKAILLEDYFANGPDFSYTLSLTGQINRELDPIADFLLNKRKGHCQYFASALVLLLRSLDVPARIVVGFRPSEYNELGQYFLVQQNHAHAWVEAYFTVEELRTRYPAIPNWIKKGAWLRLDPTPPGDGSNAGGTLRRSSGETLDVMQDLWSEMVLNMDKSKQSSMLSLFAETSGGSYSGIWLQIESFIVRMKSSRFIGGVLSPDRWFSWRYALAITLIGAGAAVVYRLLLWLFPNWMPRIRWKPTTKKSRSTTVEFYNRAIRALKRLGLQRKSHETPREFFMSAQSKLEKQSIPFDAESFTRLFYEIRFGGFAGLKESDQATVNSAIQALEAKVSR